VLGDAGLKGLLQSIFDGVGHFTDLRPLNGWELTNAPHDLREDPTATEIMNTPGIYGR
jgi:hypothetical protein